MLLKATYLEATGFLVDVAEKSNSYKNAFNQN